MLTNEVATLSSHDPAGLRAVVNFIADLRRDLGGAKQPRLDDSVSRRANLSMSICS